MKSREDFITDNLVNIREQLRRNYRETPEGSPQAPEEHGSAPKAAAVPSAIRSDMVRERRDFEGRFLRDGAKVRALLAELKKRQTELAEFDEFLTRASETLRGNAADDPQCGVPESLRLEYFQRLGGFEAASSGFPEPRGAEPESPHCQWMTPAAILLGAVILGAVLLVLFV